MIIVFAATSLLLPADGSRLIWLVVANLIGELVAAGIVLIRLRQAIKDVYSPLFNRELDVEQNILVTSGANEGAF